MEASKGVELGESVASGLTQSHRQTTSLLLFYNTYMYFGSLKKLKSSKKKMADSMYGQRNFTEPFFFLLSLMNCGVWVSLLCFDHYIY